MLLLASEDQVVHPVEANCERQGLFKGRGMSLVPVALTPNLHQKKCIKLKRIFDPVSWSAML